MNEHGTKRRGKIFYRTVSNYCQVTYSLSLLLESLHSQQHYQALTIMRRLLSSIDHTERTSKMSLLVRGTDCALFYKKPQYRLHTNLIRTEVFCWLMKYIQNIIIDSLHTSMSFPIIV
jgi:hypothetical protein